MIGALAGRLKQKTLSSVIVDAGGVGYLLQVSSQTLAELPQEDEQVDLLCHTYVREDALQLFGFATPSEKAAFELLIAVSGVGPKLALTILSGMAVGQLTAAISQGNHARLQGIPGVGKKTAERLVVELSDRFTKLARTIDHGEADSASEAVEVVEALVNLGYKRPVAERALAELKRRGEQGPPEQVLRRALAVISEL